MTGARAWAALAALITIWTATCPPGQTMSEAADRGMEKHRVLTFTIGTLIYAHVLNLVSPRWDLVHIIAIRIARKAKP